MILTDHKGGMVLTPTYHVFRMYNVHQDATYLPLDVSCDFMDVDPGRSVPMISATDSRDAAGLIHISISNIDADNTQTVTVNLPGTKARKAVGEILSSANLTDHNTFADPDRVRPVPFGEAKIEKGALKITMPPASIVSLTLQ
jgi:alpha-N-arabinofuranosidase